MLYTKESMDKLKKKLEWERDDLMHLLRIEDDKCPFCNEKNIFYQYDKIICSGCNYKGTMLQFYMMVTGNGYNESIMYLSKLFNIEMEVIENDHENELESLTDNLHTNLNLANKLISRNQDNIKHAWPLVGEINTDSCLYTIAANLEVMNETLIEILKQLSN